MSTKTSSAAKSHAAADAAQQPTDLLLESLKGLSGALVQRASHSVTNRIESTTKNLAQRAEGAPALASGAKDLAQGKPLKAVAGASASRVTDKVKDVVRNLTGGGGRGGSARGKLKVTNIVETVDVGVPIKVAYDQWTRFTEFPSFTKKVEHVEQKAEEKVAWSAQILWSHRQWESKIVEQVPDERIVWTSKGDKGHVDGAVSFHELAPSLTRITVVLVYYPKGLFEHVGNMFRAQGRRARLELKHFQRHVMTQTVLHADELEGWRGEIHDGKVTDGGDSQQDQRSQDQSSPDQRSSKPRGAPAKKTQSANKSQSSNKSRATKKSAASSRSGRSSRRAGTS